MNYQFGLKEFQIKVERCKSHKIPSNHRGMDALAGFLNTKQA